MDNPLAQDTLEGIVEWWLLQQELKRSSTLIQRALEILTREGLVIELKELGGTYYRINREKYGEIRSIVKKINVD
jgi:DNA-binding transcriptional ArsR family regulator